MRVTRSVGHAQIAREIQSVCVCVCVCVCPGPAPGLPLSGAKLVFAKLPDLPVKILRASEDEQFRLFFIVNVHMKFVAFLWCV